MAEFTDVDLEQLDRHAQQVGDVAHMVSGAHGAGQQVGLGGIEAYGLLCSPLMIPALQMFQGDMDELLKSAADLADAISEGLKTNSMDYAHIERLHTDGFDKMGRDT